MTSATEASSAARLARAESFWRTQLAGLVDRCRFPVDLSGPVAGIKGGRSPVSASVPVPVTGPLTERLLRMSRGRLEALHVLLTAGMLAVLARYTRRSRVSVGQPSHGGPGHLLVLRADTSGSLRELLMDLRDTLGRAIAHQDFPIATLAADLGRPPEPDEHPFVDVAVEMRGLHEDGVATTAGVGVVLSAERDGSGSIDATGLTVKLHYDQARYLPQSAQRIARHFVRLLDRATAEPDRALSGLTLWTRNDERIVASGHSGPSCGDPATIHELFARQVALNPGGRAVHAGDLSMTYAELHARSNQLAHTLRARGVGRGHVVGGLTESSVETVVAFLATLKAGGVFLPIDATDPPTRIACLLSDSRASLVLAPTRQGRQAGATTGNTPVVDLTDPASYAELPTTPEPVTGADDLAYLCYTSSTSAPAGVQVEHRGVVDRLTWLGRAYPIGVDDVVLHASSLASEAGCRELLWPLCAGAGLVLFEPAGTASRAAIVRAIHQHQVSIVHFGASLLTLLLGYVDRFGAAEHLANLRLVFTGDEPLPPGQARRFTSILPHSRLVQLYGPIEASGPVTHHPVGDVGQRARVPIGRPGDHVRAHVLDEAGRRVPVGVPGELYLAGPGLARGYHGRPELTEQRFLGAAGPGSIASALGERRLYRTGDLVRWLDDATLEHLGRVDRRVVVRGHRVDPGEIEQCLRAHPAVAAAAVLERADGWQTALRGFVVARGAVSETELRQHLRDHLPEHLVPARIEQLSELPVRPDGTLDRAALRDAGGRSAAQYVAPRDERERTMAAIWGEVLGLARVGVLDNFFALGGNSIHFVAVLAKARAEGLAFTFQELFEHQTIARLVAHTVAGIGARNGDRVGTWVEASDGEPGRGELGEPVPGPLLSARDRAALPPDAEDAYPLSMLQAGLIFQTEITGAQGQYHDVLSYLIGGSFDRDAFTGAVRLLTSRHPMLRTTYHLTGFGEFIQIVHREVESILSVEDLRGLDAAEQERWYVEWLDAEKRRRFEWERGGLVTLHVHILANDRYRYTVSQHNSALDGWSITLLHTQLFDLYTQLRAGREPGKVSVDQHLRTFVELERAAMRSGASREFWLSVLTGREFTQVPRRRSPAGTGFRVVMHDVALPAGLTERVVALADELSVPVKDVLLAAHVKVLGTISGERSVLTGYEHSGRPEEPGAETALGLFLNTVPFHIDLGELSWARLVRRVYEAELALLPHRRYPMARMKQDLATQRPLFETTFNFTHFYLLKQLREVPEVALLDLRVNSETEFVLRTEFSRHHFDDDLRLSLHYHEHLFDAGQIERIGASFTQALEFMTSDPAGRHTARPLAGELDLAARRRGPPDRRRPGGLAPAPAGPTVRAGALPSGAAPASALDSTMDRIATVWADVLGLPLREVSATTDFFSLGGNSLLALRVVLETGGLITLSDLMRHPRLHDLASVVDRRQQGQPDLLQLLSSTSAGTRCALICVPYPCGHPINFSSLAAQIEELTSDVAVYGLQEPGHDVSHRGEFVGVAATARLAVHEIANTVDGSIMLWGHCGGAAVAIELARQLESEGHDLRGVFIGSKLLPTVSDMHESLEMLAGFTDEDILRYMAEESGYTELDGLDREHAAFLAAVFRHDVGNGYHYFIERVLRQDCALTAPLTFVVAADDAGLAHYAGEYRRWALVAPQLSLRVIDEGGHFFVRTKAADAAELVVASWEAMEYGTKE